MRKSIVADFFAGSGTTAVVAQNNNRKWILSDLGKISETVVRKRVSNLEKKDYNIFNFKNNKKKNIDLYLKYIEKDEVLEVSLEKYIIEIGKIKLNKEDQKVIKNILKTNSLNLIEYIGIGYKDKEDDDLKIFKELSRDIKLLKIKEKFLIDLLVYKKEKIYLKIMDVFGNSMCKKLV